MHPCKASAGPDLCRACEKRRCALAACFAARPTCTSPGPYEGVTRPSGTSGGGAGAPGPPPLISSASSVCSVYPPASSVSSSVGSSVGFHRLLPRLKGLHDLLGLLQAPHRCPPLLKGLQDWLALLQAPLPRRPARRWSSWSSRRSRTSRLQDLLALLQTSPPGLAGPLRPLARPFCRPTDLLGTAGCCSALCAKASLRTSCSAPLKQARRSQASPGRS